MESLHDALRYNKINSVVIFVNLPLDKGHYISDLQNKEELKICEKDDKRQGVSHLIEMRYPQTVFRPAPFVMQVIYEAITQGSIRIIFAGAPYTEKYEIVKNSGVYRYSYENTYNIDIYQTIKAETIDKVGKKIKIESNLISNLLSKYIVGYSVAFTMPMKYSHEERKSVIDDRYIPLAYNQEGEVISYIGGDAKIGYELVLPLCKDKDELISRLFTDAFPEIFPNIFPESREFAWSNNEKYLPKAIADIQIEKEKLRSEYDKKLKEIEERETKIKEEYHFLTELLIGTGQVLVEAVKKYFEWIGFENVTLPDGSEEILREDIQIEDGNCLYIIEVKGIAGTSTDAECAQIAKHRRKREKENRDKEVIPIYIVNHQRYIQPELRENPPFSMNQIDYAENDERGLLTTWQLYQQFYLVENGIFSKSDTRNALKEIGLISLISAEYKQVGVVAEYFQKPKASILIVSNFEISVGMEIWAKKNGEWKKGNILSLKVNDVDVETASDCEVGMVVDIELAKGYGIYVKVCSEKQ